MLVKGVSSIINEAVNDQCKILEDSPNRIDNNHRLLHNIYFVFFYTKLNIYFM